MVTFKYKRLGKLALNWGLPISATHYTDAEGAPQPIAVPRPGEMFLYYRLGEHRDLYLVRIGRLDLPEPMPLHLDRHLGGKLPSPQGKGLNKAMARAVLDDVAATYPNLQPSHVPLL